MRDATDPQAREEPLLQDEDVGSLGVGEVQGRSCCCRCRCWCRCGYSVGRLVWGLTVVRQRRLWAEDSFETVWQPCPVRWGGLRGGRNGLVDLADAGGGEFRAGLEAGRA